MNTHRHAQAHIFTFQRDKIIIKKKQTGIGDDSMLQLFDKKCKITMTKDFIRSG